MAQNANENNVLPNKTKIDHYIIESHIGHGGYGEIYSVYDDNHRGPWAMKVEMKSAKKHGLTEEIHYLKMLRGSTMFPEYICNGETSELRYFIMELLGPSVSFTRRSLPDLRYSQLTATILAKEMLKCIEELHKRGYVHRDIKPGNFLIRPNRERPIVLIDFGLSRRYADRDTMKPLPPRHNPGFIGTCSFASLNAHEGKELGRRDDIFSWIYTIIEMVDKRLPWPGSKDRERTYRLKQQIRPYDLCHSLPRAFTTIYLKTIDYQFEDKPDYQGFYRLLDRAIHDLGGYGKPFDWEKLPPETISRISAIPLDMGPLLDSSGNETRDNNKNVSHDESKDNNNTSSRKASKIKKTSSIDQNRNDENQQKSKAQREKAALNESKNQTQDTNNQKKKTKKKSNSNANTTYATNETNTSNKRQPSNQYNKQEETAPEDDNKVSKIDDGDSGKRSESNQHLRTAPPRNEPKIPKKTNECKKFSKAEPDSSNSRSDSKPKNNNSNDNELIKNSINETNSNSDNDSENQKQQLVATKTTQVNNSNIHSSDNHEVKTEELDNSTNKSKPKKKKGKGKSDDEPGCKACLIA